MKTFLPTVALLFVVALPWARPGAAQDPQPVYPTAVLPFEERGADVKDYGRQVTDVLFAELVAKPDLYLVDREDLQRTLAEQSLNVSGAVKPGEAVQVGQLTGAKLLITGSVLQAGSKLYVVAKIIGTETSRVAGASVDAAAGAEISRLAERLAGRIADVIRQRAPELVAAAAAPKDRVGAIKQQLGDRKRPTVEVKVEERHIGRPAIDPAVETEILWFCRETGFSVMEPTEKKAAADRVNVSIRGEAFSELAGQVGSLVSVRARVEVKAVDAKTGEILAVDRQTSMVVDASEHVAAKAALQEAGAAIAGRLLPKLVGG
jgi:TolB-like protein